MECIKADGTIPIKEVDRRRRRGGREQRREESTLKSPLLPADRARILLRHDARARSLSEERPSIPALTQIIVLVGMFTARISRLDESDGRRRRETRMSEESDRLYWKSVRIDRQMDHSSVTLRISQSRARKHSRSSAREMAVRGPVLFSQQESPPPRPSLLSRTGFLL